MPLVNLKSNLTNLKYGNDRLGGGSSGQPYIQFVNPNVAKPSPGQSQLNNQLLYGLDYPMRGGQFVQFGTQASTTAGQIDRLRISKFLKDAPRGTAFIEKQVGLQLSNPKMQTGRGIVGNSFLPNIIENTRVYNGGTNTLYQVASAGTGVHYPRAGLFPVDFASKYYFDTVNQENINRDSSTNRLLLLQNMKMLGNTAANVQLANSLGISTNSNLLFQYLGGPSSVYGIGSTTIKRYSNTSDASNKPVGPSNVVASSFTMTYKQINDQLLDVHPEVLYDFRLGGSAKNPEKLDKYKDTDGFSSGSITWNSDLSLQNRLKVGRPGFPIKPNNYKVPVSNAADKLNQQRLFLISQDQDPFGDISAVNNKDIIKFAFEAMDNDTPGSALVIMFRAFLSSPIADNNSAQLNSFKYVGRGDTFYTYQGFERSIGFSFRVAAQSRQDIKPMYEKLNHLISQVYPDYSSLGYMRAPLIKLTIGDYIYRMPGFLESVNVTTMQDSSWEINLEEDKSNDIGQLPHAVEVQVSFRPIMDILPRRETVTGNQSVNLIWNSRSTGSLNYYNTLKPIQDQLQLGQANYGIQDSSPIPPPAHGSVQVGPLFGGFDGQPLKLRTK